MPRDDRFCAVAVSIGLVPEPWKRARRLRSLHHPVSLPNSPSIVRASVVNGLVSPHSCHLRRELSAMLPCKVHFALIVSTEILLLGLVQSVQGAASRRSPIPATARLPQHRRATKQGIQASSHDHGNGMEWREVSQVARRKP